MKTTFIKKLICLSLVLALLLCGCNTVQNGEESTTEPHSEQITQTDTTAFVPQKNYGELAIFTGGYRDDIWVDETIPKRYGLMTLEGRIVAQAVYNRYKVFELDGKTYYSMIISENEMGSPEELKCTSLFMPSDGSWCVTLDGDINHITPERIITSKYDEYFKIYDYSGKLIYEADKNLSVTWNNGTSSHAKLVGAYNWYEDGTPLLIFDMDGNVVFDEFSFFVSFESGKSVVKLTETGLYGIISDSGEWLLDPVYSDIDSVAEDKYFVAVRDNTEVEVYDNSLNLLHSFATVDYDGQTRYYEVIGDRLVYYCGHIDAKDDYYRDMFTDEIITCKENGLPATKYPGNNLFAAFDENSAAWVFDIDGKLLLEIPKSENVFLSDNEDFITSYVYGDITVETYYRSDNGEKLGQTSCKEDEMKTLDFIDFERKLAIASNLKEIEFPYFDGTYNLINYETGKVLIEGCEEITVGEHGGKTFINAVYTDRINVYDLDLNLIHSTQNVLCD